MLKQKRNRKTDEFKSLLYVSPSVIPSRSANSIHVLHQCNALSEQCAEVKVFCASFQGVEDENCINKFYGIQQNSNVQIIRIKLLFRFAIQLQIAILALYYMLFKQTHRHILISRNFYFSVIVTILGFDHLYETHGPEVNWLKRVLQNFVMKRNKVICISNQLSKILSKQCKNAINDLVLHDAASPCEIVDVSRFLIGQRKLNVGYFGHLYPGRGVEIIIGLAELFPDIDFYVVGGTDEKVNELRRNVNLSNFHILGFLRNNEARSLMKLMDVLLMPYQRSVGIGQSNVDTAKWMSPLKMFEYMSSQTAIISSDLPVLQEVLTHAENAILVEPANLIQWQSALVDLRDNESLRKKLGQDAYSLFSSRYTWSNRAKKIIEFASNGST